MENALAPRTHRFDSPNEISRDLWRWGKYFQPYEMACRGSGEIVVNEAAMDALFALREDYGEPFSINSAYRSKRHNRAVGGSSNSYHLRAEAFDISVRNLDPAKLARLARKHGFRGIGFYPGGAGGFVHIDMRPTFAEWGDRFPDPKPLAKSKTLWGSIPAFLIALSGELPFIEGLLQEKAGYHWLIESALPLVVIAGIAVAIFARISDRGRVK